MDRRTQEQILILWLKAEGGYSENSANSGAEAKAIETAPVVEAPKAEKKAGEDIAKVEDVELKPIGRGKFGNIYDQFRGKPKEALAFLKENKEGDLIGVFYHDEIGDIDLVWGDEKSGLSHINSKHVGDNRSFATLDIAIEHIEDIIKSGDVTFTNGDKVVIKKNDELVTLRKNIRENGKKIADKNWILTAYNEKAADNTRAISVVNKGHAAPTTAVSESKGSEKVEDNEGKVNKSEVGRYPKELFEGVKDNAMAVRDAKTIFDKYSKVASIEEMIEYRDTLIAWDYLNGSISDAENGLTKITDEEYDSLLEAQRQTDHRLTEIRDDFEKRLEESQKIEAQKAMQERASRMPKPPVKVDAIQEAIDKGDAELESQLLGELQKWVNTDITAEWIPEVENTIHNLETVKSKVKSPSGRYVLDKTLASYKIAQILKKRLKAIKKEESNRATNPNAEVAKASKAKTAKKKAGEDIAKVEEAMKAEKAKRELKTKEDIEKRLAEIREEYEADKEGRDIQTQAEAMVELYGGYANAPKDVKAKIDAQVAKLSARRQELVAEERELEKKLATLAKKQTSTTLDTRTEGQKEDGGYSENSANSGAIKPYLKTDAELTEGEQKGIEYEINRLADGFGLKPSQLRGVEVKHNADNTVIMVATEWSEGASTARVVELIADNGTSQPDRIWQAYVDGKPASKLMVDEDVNARDMEELFDERGLLREPTIEDFLKRRGIEFSIVDRDKATETAPVVEAPKAEKKVRKPRAKSRPVDAKKELNEACK